jgi:sensor histidine kinase YesM
LKQRLWIFLICCCLLPIVLIGGTMLYKISGLYTGNVAGLIENGLGQQRIYLQNVMDTMRYTSQQIIYDEVIGKNMAQLLGEENPAQRVQLLREINGQTLIYELANPNVCNISYLMEEGGLFRKINSSLIRNSLPPGGAKLCVDNLLTYYGPHKTLSVASEYNVISLVREFSDAPGVYMYIESGYKQLDREIRWDMYGLDVVYGFVSETGRVVYSSDPGRLALEADWAAAQQALERGRDFHVFSLDSPKWRLVALAGRRSLSEYAGALSASFYLLSLVLLLGNAGGAVYIWRSIRVPLRKFNETLKSVTADGIVTQVDNINVEEFDKNFMYFNEMKSKIIELVTCVEEKEKEKSALYVKQVLSKINPHFLHNTLDTLRWYAAEKNQPEISAFVLSLNQLLLYNLERTKTTTLENEMDAIANYLTLQSYKYDIDFQYTNSLPAPMRQAVMPRFILQPLVENAILHGLRGRGKIAAQISLAQDGRISVKIINDGQPPDVAKIQGILASPAPGAAIGLQYVLKALEDQFGPGFSFAVTGTQGMETQVEILFPWRAASC